jgi:hypothetical protein
MDGSCCANLFNPSRVEILFPWMTTGSVASRRNPWLFVSNRCRGMSGFTSWSEPVRSPVPGAQTRWSARTYQETGHEGAATPRVLTQAAKLCYIPGR